MQGVKRVNPDQGKLRHESSFVLVALLLAGLTWQTANAAGLSLQSAAFSNNGAIPKRFTCQGENISPPLRWNSVPAAAKSLVLIVDDPDAPDPSAPILTWVHWVLYNLPAKNAALPAARKSSTLPGNSVAARNSWRSMEYGGPCPPIGRHRYFFKLYALDSKLDGLNNPGKDAVVAAMRGHIIEQTVLVGTYQKQP